MPNPSIVPITQPRVPFLNPETGFVSMPWYLFLLSLSQSQGGSSISLDDVQKGPPSLTVDEINAIIDKAAGDITPSQDGLLAQIAELQKQVEAQNLYDCCNMLIGQVAELQKQIEGLQVQPMAGQGTVNAVTGTSPVMSSGGTDPDISMDAANTSTDGYLTATDWNTFNNKQSVAAPTTYTANFAVAATDVWIINNKSGSTCTVTLPTPSASTGRVLHFQNYQTQTLVSASSNVVPLAGGAAGTAILQAVAGANATLVSDGTSWIMTQYDSNNSLELE